MSRPADPVVAQAIRDIVAVGEARSTAPARRTYRKSTLEHDGPLAAGLRLRVTDHLEDHCIEVAPGQEVYIEAMDAGDGNVRLVIVVVEEVRADGRRPR